jgi:hypothetical protein
VPELKISCMGRNESSRAVKNLRTKYCYTRLLLVERTSGITTGVTATRSTILTLATTENNHTELQVILSLHLSRDFNRSRIEKQ